LLLKIRDFAFDPRLSVFIRGKKFLTLTF